MGGYRNTEKYKVRIGDSAYEVTDRRYGESKRGLFGHVPSRRDTSFHGPKGSPKVAGIKSQQHRDQRSGIVYRKKTQQEKRESLLRNTAVGTGSGYAVGRSVRGKALDLGVVPKSVFEDLANKPPKRYNARYLQGHLKSDPAEMSRFRSKPFKYMFAPRKEDWKWATRRTKGRALYTGIPAAAAVGLGASAALATRRHNKKHRNQYVAAYDTHGYRKARRVR